MTPRLSGHFSIVGLVFFVLKTMPGVVKNLQFCPQSLAVMIEFLYIERGLLQWMSPRKPRDFANFVLI